MNIDELKSRILAKHNTIMQDARRMFSNFRYAPEPAVYFFNTGRAAGLAHGHSKVGYNLSIFSQDAERFINTTIAHEIAHIVCSYTGMDKGHGKNWKRVCTLLGGNAKRCFSADGVVIQKLRNRKQYEYRGTCGTLVMLSDVRHNKLCNGGSALVIRKTRGKIDRNSFTGKVV